LIEQGIYFALGCIITALAALMFAPLFWRRALRLTRKRLQLQIPLSMQEIRAEHDQLRATFAVERLRIEQAADKIRATKAADMAEIGRRDVTIADLEAKLVDAHSVGDSHLQKIASHERDLADHRIELAQFKISLDQALTQRDEAHVDRDTALADGAEWRTQAEAQVTEIGRLRDAVESHRTTIAGLETRAMGLEMRLTDNERSSVGRLKAAE
jgi:chromosome segregation ATPase